MYRKSDSSSSSSASSSPTQMMSENTNLINSFIITNGLVSRLSGGASESTSLQLNGGDKKSQQSTKNSSSSNKNCNSSNNNGVSIEDKKPLRRLNNSNCETQSDAAILKIVPHLFDRFVEVVDSVTKSSCNMMMCKSCRFLLKKNADILLSHLCKQKHVDKFSSIPIVDNELIFRSKPKNRATPIWDEFEEVIEPASNILLGYARCKRCFEIIKTSDPKSIPAVLRRHAPQCPCGPLPARLLVHANKSSSENSHSNQKNSKGNNRHHNNSTNSNTSSKAINSSLNNTNNNNSGLNNSSAHNLSSFIKELSSNNLINVMKNLTNQNNLTSLNSPLNLNGASSPLSLMPLVNNLTNSVAASSNANTTVQATSNPPAARSNNSSSSSSSSKLNHLKNEFRESCIELCYKELISLEALCSPSFKRLCQTLMQIGHQTTNQQQSQLPDSSQLYYHLYTKYSSLRFQIKSDLQLELAKNAGGALVCDSQDELCVLATYYISNDWKFKEVVLSADAYGNEINYFITNTLNDYQLNEEDKLSKFTFVSRGGHFDGVQISLVSIAHTIDHIINSTIFFDDTYTDIVENCRLVCNELGIDVVLDPIVQNVDWIAKYEIMRHVLINIEKYELKNYPLNFDLIRFLVDLLTPFRNACEELRNCSKHPTLNHVLLWYYKIMKHLEEDDRSMGDDEELDDELDDSTFIRKTKKSVRDAVEEFFELHSLHKIAVFLWPNFRSLKMLTADERTKVHDEVRKLIDTRIPQDDEAIEKKVEAYQFETSSKKARTDFALWEDANPLLDQDELQRYVSETLTTCDENTVLPWWKEHQSKYPKLSQLAKWILSIPASVTLIEKFKLHKNSKIDEELLFLHCNLFDK